MIVEVVGGAATAPEVRVSDVEDLAHLQLAVGALTEEEADFALRESGLGRLADASTGFLDVVALKAAAGAQAAAPDWSDRFDDMVRSARSKGWVADDGASLQAHVESAASG